MKPRMGLLSVLVLLFAVWPAAAQVAETPRIRLKQVSKIQLNGDIQVSADVVFSTQMYPQLKNMISNTSVLVRELGISGQVEEVKDIRAEYDDGRHAIKVTATVLGGMKNRGREWMAEMMDVETYEVIDQDPDAIRLLTIRQLDSGTLMIGTVRGEFPEGTKNTRLDAGRGGVFREVSVPAPKKDGVVDADMQL